MELTDALGLHDRRTIYIVGGGGKTTLMFALAGEHTAGRVVTSTSTRILPPPRGPLLLETDPARLLKRIGEARGPVTVAHSLPPDGKLRGLPLATLDRLAPQVDLLLVEADGSAGRSLKGYRPDEPVISSLADAVVLVVGVDAVGCTLDDAHVHRAGLLGAHLGLVAGALCGVDEVARALLHPSGPLRQVPAQTPVSVLISKVNSPARQERAEALRARLLESPRVAGVVLGTLDERRRLRVIA